MKIQKLLAILLCLALCFAFFAGCAKSSGDTSTEPSTSELDTSEPSTSPVEEVEEITLKLAHGLPQAGMTGQQYNSFCEFVEELSGGKMKVEQLVGGSLLSDTETLDAVMEGQIDFVHNMVSYASGTIGDLALLEVPGYYVGDDWLGFAQAAQEPLEEIYAAYNIKYLAANYQGTTTFVATKNQITNPDDMNGLAFRTSGTWLGKAMENWGASATTIGLSDLTTALERGTVDGTYTGWTITGAFKLYEVSSHVTFTSISEGYAGLLMSMDTWNDLSPAQQAIIEEAAQMYLQEAYTIGMGFRDQYYSDMEAYGTDLYTLSSDEEKAFTDLSTPLFDEIEPNLSDTGKALLDVIKSYQ